MYMLLLQFIGNILHYISCHIFIDVYVDELNCTFLCSHIHTHICAFTKLLVKKEGILHPVAYFPTYINVYNKIIRISYTYIYKT